MKYSEWMLRLVLRERRWRRCFVMLLAAIFVGCHNEDNDAETRAGTSEESEISNTRPAVIDSRPNAAPEYLRIDALMGRDIFDPLVELDATQKPDAEQSRYLVSKKTIIAEIMAASHVERCDFSLNYTAGEDMAIPHLGAMRRCTQLLVFDASRCMHSPTGSDEAAERISNRSGLLPR